MITKFLITGGAGFIGSEVVRQLVKCQSNFVLNFDKLTYAGNLDSLSAIQQYDNYEFFHGDICDSVAVNKAIEKFQPNIIIHLAAESHVDRSIDGPREFIRTNVFGTYQMLDSAWQYFQSLGRKEQDRFRFHHVSTDEVYGDLGKSGGCFVETSAYDPSSPYSASKASSDHLVRAWHRTFGLPILITNCTNNYGPYQFPEKFIPHMVLNAISGKAMPVYGDGLQVRDWLHVEDHAEAIILVAKKARVGTTFNIGGDNQITNIDVVRRICLILEKLVPDKPDGIKVYADLIDHVNDRPGHDICYAVDASKIQNQLKWFPKKSFEIGLLKTVKWYLENENWWRRVIDGDYMLDRLGKG